MHKESQRPFEELGLSLASVHHYVILLKTLQASTPHLHHANNDNNSSTYAEDIFKRRVHTRKNTLNAEY